MRKFIIRTLAAMIAIGISPVLALAKMIEAEEGVSAARHYLSQQLRDRPSVRGEAAQGIQHGIFGAHGVHGGVGFGFEDLGNNGHGNLPVEREARTAISAHLCWQCNRSCNHIHIHCQATGQPALRLIAQAKGQRPCGGRWPLPTAISRPP